MGRSAYDFEVYGTKNLPRYMKSFELPPLPQCDPLDILLVLDRPVFRFENQRDRDGTVEYHSTRVLENIFQIALQSTQISSWINKSLPRTLSANAINFQDGMYYLPAALSDKIYSHKPSDISQMENWICLVTTTTLRVMHLAFPRTSQWNFKVGTNPQYERAWFRYALWTTRSGPSPAVGSLVFAYQTPFCLNEQDMQEFVQCKAFPTPQSTLSTGLQGKFRLWAKLWDACAANKTRWFVLTSYSQWVFGVFAAETRVAFLTPIYQYNSNAPTILELMVYWLASAMQLPGAYRPPQVDTPIGNDMEVQVKYDVFPQYRPVPKREDFWLGKNDEPGSSAGVRLGSTVLSQEGSMNSVYPEPEQVEMKKPEIQRWLASFPNARHRKLDEDDLHQAPISNCDANDDFDPNVARGAWMVPM